MSSPLVSLAWDGHHRTLVSVFEKLLVNSHFVDCTIVAEGQKMKIHKEILSAFSPFFELLFREEIEKNPTVIISGITFRDLKSLVDFIYQGKLEVSEDRIQDLIDAAECLQIKGLGGGHKEKNSGYINDIKELTKGPAVSSGIPHTQTNKGEREEAGCVNSQEREANNLNYSNVMRPENSVVITCGVKQPSLVQTVMPNPDLQNVAMISNTSLMPLQSTRSEIEMNRLQHLQGEYVVKKVLDSVGDKSIIEPLGDTGRGLRVCGSRGISKENCGYEAILGLSADISVPSEKKMHEDLPLDYVTPALPSSKLSSKLNFTGSSVRNELRNINVNLSSESVNPVVSAEDTQDPLFHSEFLMKSEDETLLSVDDDSISEKDEFSENMSERIEFSSVTDVQMKVMCTEKESASSGANSGCTAESTPQGQPAVFVTMESVGRNESAVGLMAGLAAELSTHDFRTHPSRMTPVCERDLPGPTGRAGGNESSLTNILYRCQICNKAFTRNLHLNVHMRLHAEDTLFRSDECNYGAVTSIKLNDHHNQNGRKLYKCSICDFKSTHRGNLREHMGIHSGVKLYKCKECDYTSVSGSNVDKHKRIHSGVKPYKCTECDYTAVSSSDVNKHMRLHSRVKHKCAECDYLAVTSSNLNKHMRIHRVVKSYKCKECDYISVSSSNMNKHKRTHSGVKPYKCTECGYAAAQHSVLTRHLRRHSGVKPYKCSECNYAAIRRDALKSHQRTHRRSKP